MGKSSGSKIKPIGLRGYVLVLLALWTVFVGSVLFWTLLRQKPDTLETARCGARSAFQKDLAYRRWAASHGGVYVAVTQDTPPNPYLADV